MNEDTVVSSNAPNSTTSSRNDNQQVYHNTALSPNRIWKTDFLDLLEQDGCVGPELEIACPRHPSSKKRFKAPNELLGQIAEGNLVCDLICNKEMACGHKCKRPCHAGACFVEDCKDWVAATCAADPSHPKLRRKCCEPEVRSSAA